MLSSEINTEEYQWLLTRIETVLHKFQRELRDFSLSDEITKSSIPHLLGIGEGSTPQSDDIFLGIILAIKCKEPSVAKFLDSHSTIKYESYTTKKSASLIRSFLRGNYPEELKKFIELLMIETITPSQTRRFRLEIQKIKRIGASSGYSFLVGVLWQLRYYENQ